MRTRRALFLAMVVAACRGEAGFDRGSTTDPRLPDLGPTRGVILISLDTLRADRLGAYGYDGGTSPFLDRLAAARGIVFERAVAQYPGTLISHMSMLTGLYPQEHGVLPPASVLSPEVPLLAELLSGAGVVTAGHTEGGFMDGDFGFARGFEEFSDTPYSSDRDVERTLGRGLEFLAGFEQLTERAAAQNKPFFLFLHTYSIHDPYEPPPGYGADVAVALDPPPTGEVLRDANRGFLTVPEGVVDAYNVRYDASIRYVDEVLWGFFDRLDGLGLGDETAVIVTADHGEAFGEHGRLGHEQTYPEELLVPLILIHPELNRGYRVAAPAELIDITPTVLDLLGVSVDERAPPMSGRSLLAARGGNVVHAENADPTVNRVLLREDGDSWWMLVETAYLTDPDGAWLPLDHSFDVQAPATPEVVAFNGPKPVKVMIDGEEAARMEVAGEWTEIEVRGEGRQRVSLVTDSCTSPRLLGVGDDPRCLSLKLRGTAPRRLELFELGADPAARVDRSWDEPQRLRRLYAELETLEFPPRGTSGNLDLDPETRKTLEALGYL